MAMSLDDMLGRLLPLFEKKMQFLQEMGQRELSLRERQEQNKTDLEYRKLDDVVKESKYAKDWEREKVGILHAQNLSLEAAKSNNLITQAGVTAYYDDLKTTKANTASEKAAKEKSLSDMSLKAAEAGFTVHKKYNSEGVITDTIEGTPQTKAFAEGQVADLNKQRVASQLSPALRTAAANARKSYPPLGASDAEQQKYLSSIPAPVRAAMLTSDGVAGPQEAPKPLVLYEDRNRAPIAPAPLTPMAPTDPVLTPAEIQAKIDTAYPAQPLVNDPATFPQAQQAFIAAEQKVPSSGIAEDLGRFKKEDVLRRAAAADADKKKGQANWEAFKKIPSNFIKGYNSL